MMLGAAYIPEAAWAMWFYYTEATLANTTHRVVALLKGRSRQGMATQHDLTLASTTIQELRLKRMLLSLLN